MTAVLNYKYAERHNYDYLFLHVSAAGVEAALGTKYNVSNYEEVTKVKRYKPSILHTGYKRLRGQSWGKLLALLHVARKFGRRYDYYVFLDPDAVIAPFNQNRSVSDCLRRWQDETSVINDTFVQWGQRNLAESSLVLLTNTPWRDDMPNAGFILMKSGSGLSLLEEWWNYHIPEKDTVDFHEQDALWYMVQANESYQFAVNKSSASIIFEPFLLSTLQHVRDMWAVHLPNYEWNHAVYLSIMLQELAIDETKFASLVHSIILNNSEIFETLQAAEMIDIESSKTAKLQTFPPVLQGDEDYKWHTAAFSTLWSKERPRSLFEKSPAHLLDGFSFRIFQHREIYFVANGTKHVFQDIESFRDYGQSKGRTFHLLLKRGFQFSQENWSQRLPEGEPIPKAHVGPNIDLPALYWNASTSEEERWFHDFPPILHDGSGVKHEDVRSKEIWWIENRTRHSIPNWDTFLSLNFTSAVSQLRGYQMDLLELGSPLPNCCP